MKFPRNARISRGQLDAAPFAGVLFCLLIFVLLSSLVYTPGVRIDLPESVSVLPGVDGPAVAVAMDANGQLYFQNQIIVATNLLKRLQSEVARQSEPVTLVVEADKAATLEQLNRLRDLAASAGIKQISQAVLPRVFDKPVNPKSP
ncbi:MAG TPA: biopolymer transporter ExbD [Verrucomicrobiae bacterium]|jgi:biopolymer transport protein ExbD|nr:biopolymer transporter ExbD [Verrucomicrobiae bacterium]